MSVISADVNVRHFRTFVYFCRVKFSGVKTSFKREKFSSKTAQTKLELASKERAQAIP